MKPSLKSLLIAATLCLAGHGAWAQSLPQGVSIKDLNATRQADGQWIITSAVSNHRNTAVAGLSVTYALYDAQGNEIGRVTGQRDTPLAPGDTWQSQTVTTTNFARFSAKEIKEAPVHP